MQPGKTINETGDSRHVRRALGFYFCYLIFLLVLCIYSYKSPAYNWDILPYMGVILKYENGKDLHQRVYQVARVEIPEKAFNQLTDSTNKYRSGVARNAAEYDLQLPFYVIKPLYTGMAYLFYKAGVPLSRATVLPSIFSYFLLCTVMFYWLQRYIPILFAFIASVFIAVWGPMLMLAKLSTPDGLSAILLLCAFTFFSEKMNIALTYTFLLLSIFSRIDNILPCLVVLLIMLYAREPQLNISLKKFTLMLLGAFTCYLLVSSRAYEYGWNLFYYPEFYKHLNTSYDFHAPFSVQNYWALVKSQFMTGLFYSHLPLFFILATLLLSRGKRAVKNNGQIRQLLTLAFVLIIVTRFILQPVIADRLYIAYYMAMLIFLSREFHSPHTGMGDGRLSQKD